MSTTEDTSKYESKNAIFFQNNLPANPPVVSQVMTKEEEDDFNNLIKQRSSSRQRSPAFYAADFSSTTNGNSGKTLPNASHSVGGKILSHTSRLQIGFSDTIGKVRPTMEDEISICGTFRGQEDEDYIGIFDGHGGSDCAVYASKNLHKILIERLAAEKELDSKAISKSLIDAFLKTNSQITSEKVSGGSTCLVSFVKKNKCFVANAGDSRAVLGTFDPSKHKKGEAETKRITTDHKPDHPVEMDRIKKNQGYVQIITAKNGKTIARVNGMLAVSRAMGDIFLQPYVTAEPDVHEFDLNGDLRQVLVMGCDGVWDVLEDNEVVEIAMSEDDPEVAAKKIRDTALAKGSTDNISVSVIQFPGKYTPTLSESLSTPSTPTTPLLETLLAESQGQAEHPNEGPGLVTPNPEEEGSQLKKRKETPAEPKEGKIQKTADPKPKPEGNSNIGTTDPNKPTESPLKLVIVIAVILAAFLWKYLF